MKRSIVAVIVTYNRLQSLRKAIAAIMAQSFPLSEVIIIDNKSTDETPRFLEEQARRANRYPLDVVTMEKNEGGAGGFAKGMAVAYERGADLIWIMDDDCLPEPDGLEKLVRGFDNLAGRLAGTSPDRTTPVEPGFVCSNVRWKDGEVCEMNIPKPAWDWSRYFLPDSPYVGVICCSFVSVLVNARVLPLVGYPVREFFVWFDDVEFTTRVARLWPGFAILDSLVVHEIPRNQGVRVGDVNTQNVWKFQYGIRNEAAVLASQPLGMLRVLRFVAALIVEMKASKVPFPLQMRVAWSGLSGLAFRYKSKIRFPAPRGG